ncbi:MAG: hypothetical protein V5B30_21720 [Candidatus Accumulibacter delftensis]|jgi:hypothetical protein
MSLLQRRLTKLEQYRQSNDVGWELDRAFERAGTTRAAVMAEFGSLWAYRDWLVTQDRASEDSVTTARREIR